MFIEGEIIFILVIGALLLICDLRGVIKGKTNKVHFIDDQPITPIPKFCIKWPCYKYREKARLYENELGFMTCPLCSASYGAMN